MTIFSVQRFLEDYLERRGLADIDQYAVRVANAFEKTGQSGNEEALVIALSRVRTAFFRRNNDLDRKAFERQLSAVLRRHFKKKAMIPCSRISSGDSLERADDCAHGADLLNGCSESSRQPLRLGLSMHSGTLDRSGASALSRRKSPRAF